MTAVRPLARPLVALALIALVTSCHSGSSSTPAVVTHSNATSTTPSASPSRSITPRLVHPCQAKQLRARGHGSRQVSNGSVGGYLVIRDTSPQSCSLRGFVRIVLLSSSGEPMRTSSVHRQTGSTSTVTIAARRKAFAGYSFLSSQPGITCPAGAVTQVRVYLPGGRGYVTAVAPIRPCDRRRTVYVGPVRSTRTRAERDEV